MRRFRALLCGASLIAVVGCGTPVTNSVETALINALTNTLAPGVNTAIAEAVTNGQGAINLLSYALPWAQRAIDYLGPMRGIDPAKIAKIDSIIAIAEADLAHPPTSIGAAVAQAVNTFNQVKAALSL